MYARNMEDIKHEIFLEKRMTFLKFEDLDKATRVDVRGINIQRTTLF